VRRLTDIAWRFLVLGATSYGGPAILGVMQAELQDRRQWLSRGRFVEGLSVVNMLPGATATQLGILLGHVRGGWPGGLVAGLCFMLPAFGIMLGLAMAHAALGLTPVARGALHGLGPVVLGIFLVAVYRLGRSTVRSLAEVGLGLGAAAALATTRLGVASILLAAGAIGVGLFHPRRRPLPLLGAGGVLLLALLPAVWEPPAGLGSGSAGATPPGLAEVATFFLKVGAFTVGGGLTMIAFIQDQVVGQYRWLTPTEFLDGLALGQLTPGPVLMLAAYVGYKLAGVGGAAVATAAAFLPSFVIMMAVLPALDRLRRLPWVQAAMRGMGPAVIGVLAVALARLAPHALPDPFAVAVLVVSVLALGAWRIGPLPLMLVGALAGIARGALGTGPATRAGDA